MRPTKYRIGVFVLAEEGTRISPTTLAVRVLAAAFGKNPEQVSNEVREHQAMLRHAQNYSEEGEA